ncbi:unnamed protein product [Dovyalis caffra]|uniref:Uncharacterized protein n=1 Tax=Dovyalis caffra TaxID=77055 RepID=A0AAV1SBU1_9ROSI|nr:unnamed protein product [Dovyalis caffra]
MTASAAVLWNKKQNARDVKQIQNIEGSTPVGSPQSWFYNADRELESVPHLSLLQATTVLYGERPDLKKKEPTMVVDIEVLVWVGWRRGFEKD